jgi:ribonuclease HII
MRVKADYHVERELWARGKTRVAGVDEVGVGALAGPVIAAAVIFSPGTYIDGLADSKVLTAKRREALFTKICECAVAIGAGRAEVEEVDRLNVYWAAMEARRRAVQALQMVPDHVLVDGKRRIAGCGRPQMPIIDGDAFVASIAAASVTAKVTRDLLMREYANLHPGYGFECHKGYATAKHMDALRRLGPLPIHRASFAPVHLLDDPQSRLVFT